MASPGMVGDNIHLLNTGASLANIEVTLPAATTVVVSLAAGQGTHVTFPKGTMGGPVVVNSDQRILASQRVQYYNSFNEIWATTAAQAATSSYFNWFDKESPGMVGDNIHLVNPGASTATGTVSMPGQNPISFSVAGGGETHMTFPAHSFGGPVKVSASQPVLASQRVQYYQSFNEVLAMNPSQAVSTSYLNWFDRESPGMVGDNIHLLNPNASAATVTVSLPGA